MSDFDKAFAIIIGHEGGYVNDARDPGGETKYGISKRYHPNEDIKAMTLDRAKQIYKAGYWDRVSGDRLPWPWDLLLFDTVVNQGGGPAYWIAKAQDAVGSKVDGIIGPNTIAAMARLSGNAAMEAVALYTADRILRYVEKSKPVFHRGLFKRAILTAMEATSGAAMEAVALYTADRILRYVEKSKPAFHRGLFKRAILTAMEATSGIA